MKISIDLHKPAAKAAEDAPRQLVFRVRDGKADLRCRTDLLVKPEFWDKSIPGYKSTDKLPREEVAKMNKLLADITSAIFNGYTPGCDGTWLRNTIDDVVNPKPVQKTDDYAAATADRNPVVKGKRGLDPTLRTLDKGSLCDWFYKFTEVNKMVPGRVSCYRSCIKKLRRFELFQREFRGKPGYTLYCDTLTVDQLLDFWRYIEEEHLLYLDPCYSRWFSQFHIDSRPPQPYTLNHKMATLKMVKTFMNWMLSHGYTTNDCHKAFALHRDVYAPPVFLTLEERDKVYSLDLTAHPRLQLHRDVFMFQCLVGCRIGDLFRLTESNIKDGWLEYYPSKSMGNGTSKKSVPLARVPLNDKALALTKKYCNGIGDKLFPVYSEPNYNIHVRMILMLAGIDRLVWARDPKTKDFIQMPLYEVATSHVARKTFIANIYKQVKDPNLIASMTGHMENSRAFARYREIDDEIKRGLIAQID